MSPLLWLNTRTVHVNIICFCWVIFFFFLFMINYLFHFFGMNFEKIAFYYLSPIPTVFLFFSLCISKNIYPWSQGKVLLCLYLTCFFSSMGRRPMKEHLSQGYRPCSACKTYSNTKTLDQTTQYRKTNHWPIFLKLWRSSFQFFKDSSNRKPSTACNPYMIGHVANELRHHKFRVDHMF